MGCSTAPRSPRSRQRGVTLFESLVAFLVLAAGTAAVAQLQSHLRLAADVARERSEAVRIAQETIEDLRSFAAIEGAPGQRAYAAIAAGAALVAAESGGARGVYRVERRIDDAAFGAAKSLSVAVGWTDRAGAPREVVVHSLVAAADPAYSGSLALDVGAIPSAPRGVLARAPSLPLTARRLGDGRSVWKPIESGATALVFDDRTGTVVGRCDAVATTTVTRDLSADGLRGCAAGRWLLVAGTVRFATAFPSTGSNGVPPATAVAIDLRDGSYPAPAGCFSEAQKTVRYVAESGVHMDDVGVDTTAAAAGIASWQDTGDRFVAWHCIVAPRADGRWSGRIALVASGWTIGTGSADGRVCRHASAAAGAAIDANIATAGVDRDVGAALLGRNFLVVRGSEPCPRTPPTEQHQP